MFAIFVCFNLIYLPRICRIYYKWLWNMKVINSRYLTNLMYLFCLKNHFSFLGTKYFIFLCTFFNISNFYRTYSIVSLIIKTLYLVLTILLSFHFIKKNNHIQSCFVFILCSYVYNLCMPLWSFRYAQISIVSKAMNLIILKNINKIRAMYKHTAAT
jgi:hypothetical protein